MAEISHKIFLRFIAEIDSYKFPKEIFGNYQLSVKMWKHKLNMTSIWEIPQCKAVNLFLSPLLTYLPGDHLPCALTFNMPRLLNNVPFEYHYFRKRNRTKRKKRRKEEEKQNQKLIQLPSVPFFLFFRSSVWGLINRRKYIEYSHKLLSH